MGRMCVYHPRKCHIIARIYLVGNTLNALIRLKKKKK